MKPHIVTKLTELLHENNKYVRNLKTAVESMNQDGREDLGVVIQENKQPATQHPRCYNAPSGDEVGILMPNEPTATRDIVTNLAAICTQTDSSPRSSVISISMCL